MCIIFRTQRSHLVDGGLQCNCWNFTEFLWNFFQCENKEHFIERITQMDVNVQKSLVEYIQQITDNPDNVLAFRPNDLAEYTTEWVMDWSLKFKLHLEIKSPCRVQLFKTWLIVSFINVILLFTTQLMESWVNMNFGSSLITCTNQKRFFAKDFCPSALIETFLYHQLRTNFQEHF